MSARESSTGSRRKRKPAKTPIEKLTSRYETRWANLKRKRDRLAEEYNREVSAIDAELESIGEILAKLRKP